MKSFPSEKHILNEKELKDHGLKVTLPRLKILEIFEHHQRPHLSAEEVYQALLRTDNEVSIATVYRVLTQFETAGLITRHHFEGESAVYELNNSEHHDHLVCIKCGSVEEFIDEVIEERQKKIAERSGFQMTDHQLNIYGICSQCGMVKDKIDG